MKFCYFSSLILIRKYWQTKYEYLYFSLPFLTIKNQVLESKTKGTLKFNKIFFVQKLQWSHQTHKYKSILSILLINKKKVN